MVHDGHGKHRGGGRERWRRRRRQARRRQAARPDGRRTPEIASYPARSDVRPTRGSPDGPALPGPRGYPLIGVIPDLLRDVTALPLLRDAWRTYGDAVQLPLGPYKVCFFGPADAVKHILVDNRENYPRAKYQMRWLSRVMGSSLVASEGEQWRTRRHLMHTLFTARAVAGYTDHMAAAIDGVVGRWERRMAAARGDRAIR